jgi:hypothetical protein
MDRYAKTKKGMNISQKTRVKVAGLINDLHLLQSLPGITNEVAKTYRLGHQFMKYLRELEIIHTKDRTVLYTNPKNHSTDYILDYVMSRYEAEYSKEDTPSDNPPLLAVDVQKAGRLSLKDVNLNGARHLNLKGAAQEIMYKNEIRNLQSDLNRREAYIHTLKRELEKKEDIISSLTKKKSIFARIKTLFK